jgi:transposase
MEVLYQHCAGLDVHKKNVKVCLITPGADGQLHKELRTYATTTQDLLQMHDWLHSQGCTHVAMESTGVYWKPIYNLFEGDFTLLVVNARHIKTVPGRKTDVKDAEWIADLLQHGLLHASFIPWAPQRELRDLTRYRTRLVEERAREINRLQKTLEDTNLTLGDVGSSVMGKASRCILDLLVEGETDPALLAGRAVGRVHASQEQLEQALTGYVTAHHRFMLGEHLRQIDHLEQAIRRVTEEIVRRFSPPAEEHPHPEQPADAASSSTEPERSSSERPLDWHEAVILLSSIPG